MTAFFENFSTDALERDARAISGLTDFGPEAYRPALEVLIQSLSENPYLDVAGAAQLRAMLVGFLVARLRAQARFAAAKGLVPVRKPWVILGMPRSGTTALHRLLCADPAAQGLEYWLANNPQPRPPVAQWETNPDYQESVATLKAMRDAAPDLFMMHEMAANEADECNILLKQTFFSLTFAFSSTADSYEKWLWDADGSDAYAYLARMLSLIDNGQGRRWVLKDPSHIPALDAMRSAFPGLSVICIRRPVEPVIPSTAALVHSAVLLIERGVPKERVGQQQLQAWARCAHRLIDWHHANPDVPWAEAEMSMLRTDPIGTIRGIYEQLGEEFTPAIEDAINARAATLNAGHTGRPIKAEEYGLTTEAIRAAFPKEFLA